MEVEEVEWKGVERPSEKPLNILKFKGLEQTENSGCVPGCADPDLEALIDAWPELDEKVKKRILKILETSQKAGR